MAMCIFHEDRKDGRWIVVGYQVGFTCLRWPGGDKSHARVLILFMAVPSAFAAAAAEKSRSEKGAAGSSAIAGGGVGAAAEKGLLKPRSGLKPIPFD
jgi:hypothetical protein